jgi:hypothetical protein
MDGDACLEGGDAGGKDAGEALTLVGISVQVEHDIQLKNVQHAEQKKIICDCV